jgi:hypothetical protein
MTMTVAVGSVVKITARLRWAGKVDVQNVYHAQLASGSALDDGDARDDLAAWLETIYTPLLGEFPTSLVFEDIDFYNVSQDYPMGVEPWPTLTAGTGALDIQATGVAAVITAFTFYVRSRGRKFFGPLPETSVLDGVLTSATMINLASAAAAWIFPFVGGTSGQTWNPGIITRVTSLFREFRDAVVRNIPGYQRRRKEGVGS